MRSGSQALALGTLGLTAPERFLTLCSVVDEGSPRPRTVRIVVAKSGQDEAIWQHHLPAGAWFYGDGTVPWVGSSMCGVLRFRFGSQGVLRTLFADMRGGEYQIPPCESVIVDVARYTPSTDAAALAAAGFPAGSQLDVIGEITDGTSEDFTPMQFTAPSSWGAGGADASARIFAPPGAYAFELYPDSPLAPNNTFEVSPPGARRDFANGLNQPASSPLPVVSAAVTVQARGAAPQPCKLVFFVR